MKKRYSDISFLPAFLVPSTVIKLLFHWRPVDRLERSILTVSYKRNYHHKKCQPFHFSFLPTHLFFFCFCFNYTQCCTVAGLFFKGTPDSVYHLKKKIIKFDSYFVVWDIGMMFVFLFFVFFF